MKNQRIGPGALKSPGKIHGAPGIILPSRTKLDGQGKGYRSPDFTNYPDSQIRLFQECRPTVLSAYAAIAASEININPEQILRFNPTGSPGHNGGVSPKNLADQPGPFFIPPPEVRRNKSVFSWDCFGVAHFGIQQPITTIL
jgi:hypothetical protein